MDVFQVTEKVQFARGEAESSRHSGTIALCLCFLATMVQVPL